jgi:transcriptional regulator GlxA family with amidase domain
MLLQHPALRRTGSHQRNRAPARALSSPQRRPVAIFIAVGIEGADRSFGPLLAWAREHLDAPLTVEDLAEQAGMSSRHFTRAFIAETGTTPSKAVERLRIEVARQRVQSTGEAIERVAQSTGFRDPERMRRAFIRAFGQPPQSLRRAARAG